MLSPSMVSSQLDARISEAPCGSGGKEFSLGLAKSETVACCLIFFPTGATGSRIWNKK